MTSRYLLPTAVLLSACARAPGDSALAPEPDCSFRAATTCWTLGPRVPTPVRETPDSAPEHLLRQAPAVLASRADSAGPSR